MKIAALFVGVFLVCLGLAGVTAPALLYEGARVFQVPPMLYLAAAIRLVIGTILYCAAPESRAPIGVAIIGAIIFTGGVLTPFAGTWSAQLILDLWVTAGTIVARAFAVLAILIGAFVIYAVAPTRK